MRETENGSLQLCSFCHDLNDKRVNTSLSTKKLAAKPPPINDIVTHMRSECLLVLFARSLARVPQSTAKLYSTKK